MAGRSQEAEEGVSPSPVTPTVWLQADDTISLMHGKPHHPHRCPNAQRK